MISVYFGRLYLYAMGGAKNGDIRGVVVLSWLMSSFVRLIVYASRLVNIVKTSYVIIVFIE